MTRRQCTASARPNSFWISNQDDHKYFQIDAELVYTNDLLYMWVEKGVDYDLNEIKLAADKFAKETYPTNRNFFGSEWSPGVDNDPKLHILHSDQLGGSLAGYFTGADEVSSKAQPHSNEREMFYIHTRQRGAKQRLLQRRAGPRVPAHDPLVPGQEREHVGQRGNERPGHGAQWLWHRRARRGLQRVARHSAHCLER